MSPFVHGFVEHFELYFDSDIHIWATFGQGSRSIENKSKKDDYLSEAWLNYITWDK